MEVENKGLGLAAGAAPLPDAPTPHPASRNHWRVHLTDNTLVIDANGDEVASMHGDYDSEYETMEARAILIAAAPELLDALRKTRNELYWCAEQLKHRGMPGVPGDSVDVALAESRAAIAKASPISSRRSEV